MRLENISIPSLGFDPRLDGLNVFADVFGSHPFEQWHEVWLEALRARSIMGVEFPTFPPTQLQNRVHGHDSAISLGEASALYRFACQHHLAGPSSPWFQSGAMLDFGSGWGRILRYFMRDFPLKNIIGYEPSGLLAAVARGHNPYVSFLNGSYLPDGMLAANWFDFAISWSVYSHLPQNYVTAWLTETARVLKPGGAALYTTWGLRFLERLKIDANQLRLGEDVHWYSQVCLQGAGDIDQRINDYKAGEFVWFDSLQNQQYGEAFISLKALENIIETARLPLVIEVFDDVTLQQDAFVLRKI